MKNDLNLKSYEVPETFEPAAKELCNELIEDVEKLENSTSNRLVSLNSNIRSH